MNSLREGFKVPDHEVLPPFAASRMPHLSTYRRVLPVSLERMYENALDWEHLPHVHASSFQHIHCLDAGPWGWRAHVRTATGQESEIELRLDRACRRWITRTLDGHGSGAEVWTHAFPIGTDRVDIVVDFFMPGVEPQAREKLGRAYARLYERLYDEDVAMMVERQRQLDQRPAVGPEAPRERNLGPRAALALPRIETLRGRRFVVSETDGELVAYPVTCPHQLGPLAGASIEDGVITCPWHGYRFDVRTGACLSGQTCQLRPLPEVTERGGEVILTLGARPG